MTENSKSLVRYDLSKQPKKLMIIAKVNLPTFNRVVMSIVTPGYILFVPWIIYIAVTESAPAWFYLFIVGLVALSVIFGKGIFNLSIRNRKIARGASNIPAAFDAAGGSNTVMSYYLDNPIYILYTVIQ